MENEKTIPAGWQTIESVKQGDYFKKKPEAKKVWVKHTYNRFYKQYASFNYDDISDYTHTKKGTLVFTDFEF